MCRAYVTALRSVVLALLLLALVKSVNAQESTTSSPATEPTTKPTVVVGGPAPAFAGVMIKGEQVNAFEPGKVYIMEFWATWCIPCRMAIPHMNELHKKYKDKGVVIIGQNVWEPDPEAAKAFVAKMGDDMAYSVALDSMDKEPEDSKGAMSRTWMYAAGLRSIPSTWLVKDGRVIWIGHPMDLDEMKLDAARNGTLDILAAKLANEQKSERQKKQMETTQRFWDALHDRDTNAADAAVRELEAMNPDRANYGRSYRVRAHVVFKRYDQALAIARSYPDDVTDPKKAFSMRLQSIQDLLSTNPKDAAFLSDISKLLDSAKIPATDNPQGAEALVLKLRAWITCLQGDSAAAVKLQEQALAKIPTDSILYPFEVRALEGYKTGHAPALIPKHSRDKKSVAKPATQPTTQAGV